MSYIDEQVKAEHAAEAHLQRIALNEAQSTIGDLMDQTITKNAAAYHALAIAYAALDHAKDAL